MNITLIINDGDGRARSIDLTPGTTVSQVLQDNNASGIVRVNRQKVETDYVLSDGDSMTVTPTNVKMASLDEAFNRATAEAYGHNDDELAATYANKHKQLTCAIEAAKAELQNYSEKLATLEAYKSEALQGNKANLINYLNLDDGCGNTL